MKIKQAIIFIFLMLAVFTISFFFLAQSNIKIYSQNKKSASLEKQILDANKDNIASAKAESQQKIKGIYSGDHIKGDIEAPVQIIFYGDFYDEFSRDFQKTLQQAQQEFGDKIVIAFRNFYSFDKPFVKPLVLASECASEQNKFWEFYDDAFNTNQLDLDVNRIVSSIDLEQNKFNQCIKEEMYNDEIVAGLKNASNSGIYGSPTVLINNELIIGARPFDDYQGKDGEMEGLKSVIQRHLQ